MPLSTRELVALCVIALLYLVERTWYYRKARRRWLLVRETPVMALGRHFTAFGILLGAIAVIVVATRASWLWSCTGAILGLLVGIFAGRAQALVLQRELEQEGKIAPRVESWASIRRGFLLCFVGFLGALIVGLSWAKLSMNREAFAQIAAAGFMYGAGFFCSCGAYTWIWAKRKEREGYGPLIISSRFE